MTICETSRLFTLITTCQWKDVVDYLHQNGPSEAKKMLNTGKRGAAKISALQAVLAHPKCKGKVPLNLVQLLLEIAPEMALQNHLYTGNFPLHAVFYNAFFSSTKRRTIAEIIINACPSTILLKNSEGRTALHTNCSQHCNYEPIVTLLKAAPHIVAWKDNHGDLPLHLACKSLKSPNKSIQVLFDLYPQGMFVRNAQGHTPLEATIASGLPRAKLIPRINFIKDLEDLAATRASSSEGKKELAFLSNHAFPVPDKSFLSVDHVDNVLSHRNYVSHDDLSTTRSNVSPVPRKRRSDSDLHCSMKVKRQAVEEIAPIGNEMKKINHTFTPQNTTLPRAVVTANNIIPMEPKLNKSSITSSPTSTLHIDFFCNTDGLEDYNTTTAERTKEIIWQPQRYSNFHPPTQYNPKDYNTYYRSIRVDHYNYDDDMKHITSTASILSMMRNKSCEQF